MIRDIFARVDSAEALHFTEGEGVGRRTYAVSAGQDYESVR